MITDLKYKHWFECRNNRLIYDDVKMYRANVYNMNNKRGYLVFSEESEDNPVSEGSRAYYFKVLIGELGRCHEFYGFSTIDIHHELMKMFNGTWKLIDGLWQIWYPSLANMNAKDWAEYVEKVQYFAESLGVRLKPANTYLIR